ncbi:MULTISPECIES: hypothetical protein [Kitasatospora]
MTSWAEHCAQHHERHTGIDREFECTARKFAPDEPVVTHAVPTRR